MSLDRLANVTLMCFSSVASFLIHDSCCVRTLYLELVEAAERMERKVKRDSREDKERVSEAFEADVDFSRLHHEFTCESADPAKDRPHDEVVQVVLDVVLVSGDFPLEASYSLLEFDRDGGHAF